MACDDCSRLQMELSEARLKILELDRTVGLLRDGRAETMALNAASADHVAKARQSLARVIIDAAREQNQRTKELLERLRTYESDHIITDGDD